MAKKKNSVQALIGLERFTRYGVKNDKAELALFAVEPTNISVLSASNVCYPRSRIYRDGQRRAL